MDDAPTPDFPAAHSMDSAWFAVDADGKVGRFDTGEDGAVPNAAAGAGGNFEPDFDLLLVEGLLAGLALRDELVEAPGEPEEDAAPAASPLPPPKRHDERVVIVGTPSLDAADGYRDAARPALRAEATFRDGELVVVKASGPRVLVSRDKLAPARVDALRAFHDATVLVEGDLYYVLREGERVEAPPAGVFEYRHQFDGKGSGTYARSFAPGESVSLDDVHPSVREKLGALRLPVRFAEAAVVELADHLKEGDVQTWGTPLDPDNAPPPPPLQRAMVAVPPARAAGVLAALLLFLLLVVAVVLSKKHP